MHVLKEAMIRLANVEVLGAMALMLLLGVYPQPLMDLIQTAVMP